MSKKSIKDLSSRLTIEILKRIDDQSSLKSAALVCKRWKKLIESSCQWSVNIDFLTLGVCYDEVRADAALNFFMDTNRKFNEVTISNLATWLITTVISILERHGSSVVRITFDECNLTDWHHFLEMMALMPNLKKLTFNLTKGWGIRGSEVPSIGELPKLTHLKIFQLIRSDYCFVKCIRNSTLSTIKIECSSFVKEPVVELLRQQQHLTRLNLYVDKMYQFFDEAMPFQLTHLFLPQIKLQDYSKLLKFLETQTTIVALALEAGSNHSLPDFIYEFILANFQNLKSLRLDSCNLPKGLEFYKHTEANRSINYLMFLNPQNSQMKPWFAEFIRHTPNITDLTVHSFWASEDIACLAINLKKLEKLSVAMFSMCQFDCTQFPKLNCLHINKLYGSMELFVKFIKVNTQIKELTVQFLYVRDVKHFVQQTTDILELHTLRIGEIEGFSVDNAFFNIIRKNCSNLKTLDLPKSCFIQGELNDIKGLRFHDSNYNYWSHEESFYERLVDICDDSDEDEDEGEFDSDETEEDEDDDQDEF